ncbi:glycine betaine/L-proline transporter ProP [Streptomyces sp. RPT161]|uniref:glycine betaine/L-proline transporter ProP n=1 Tax=Streptomyces sp. RPT161 TaxID=3015993 RepID=UPI0022B9094A|nr:glycine betaine/L-proline transporter ProP [Streptomyces sp. RPT161]
MTTATRYTGTEAATRPRSAPDVTVVDQRMVKRAVSAAALGNAMEWFDFGVYSYIAVTLGEVFFPSSSPTAQLLSTFGAFAAAFLVRPVGGMVFGPLGDRIGRQKVLAITMIMMAAGTFAIGLIPSYATIGVGAPLLLLAARLVQGFSTGGEYGGASTFIAEYSPDKRRGFLGSWLEFGTLVGYVAGAGMVAVLTGLLSHGQLLSWGWRIPFLIAGPLGLIGLYLRLRLEETPAFAQLEQQARAKQVEQSAKRKGTLREILVGQWRAMLLCVALVLVFNVTDYMLLSYMPSYLSGQLHYDASHGLVVVLVVMVLMMAVQPFAGRLSDRFGRRPVIGLGCLGFLVLSIPALLLIRQGSLAGVYVGMAALGLLLVCFTGAMPSALPALFPTRIRYGALSIGFNISVSLFGGTTPLVVTALISATGNPMMPAYYMMAAAVIGGIAVACMPETARKPLPGSPPAVATQAEAEALARR